MQLKDNSKGAVRDINAVLTFCMETSANSLSHWDGDADSWKKRTLLATREEHAFDSKEHLNDCSFFFNIKKNFQFSHCLAIFSLSFISE